MHLVLFLLSQLGLATSFSPNHVSFGRVQTIKDCSSDELLLDDHPELYPSCKTIVMENVDQNMCYAMCLLFHDTVSELKLAELLRTSPSKIRLAPRKLAESVTGFSSGSIPPIGFKSKIYTIFDAQLMNYDKVTVGSGHPGVQAVVSPFNLVTRGLVFVGDISVSSKDLITSDKDIKYNRYLTAATSAFLYCNNLQINESVSNSSTKIVPIPAILSAQTTLESDNSKYGKVDIVQTTNQEYFSDVKEAALPTIDVCSEMIHLVGVISRKRSMSKKLVFANLVPPLNENEAERDGTVERTDLDSRYARHCCSVHKCLVHCTVN